MNWAMGGFAEFVWPAYAVVLVVMLGILLYAWQRNRKAYKHSKNQHESN